MAKLPVVSGEKCISALERIGYQIVRIRGSHVRLRCPSRKPVTVPRHDELDRGTLQAILRTVEISSEEFITLLRG
jgi:predicted RNA binding protein YcfA (HicA-like mRNA interferase family)